MVLLVLLRARSRYVLVNACKCSNHRFLVAVHGTLKINAQLNRNRFVLLGAFKSEETSLSFEARGLSGAVLIPLERKPSPAPFFLCLCVFGTFLLLRKKN